MRFSDIAPCHTCGNIYLASKLNAVSYIFTDRTEHSTNVFETYCDGCKPPYHSHTNLEGRSHRYYVSAGGRWNGGGTLREVTADGVTIAINGRTVHGKRIHPNATAR